MNQPIYDQAGAPHRPVVPYPVAVTAIPADNVARRGEVVANYFNDLLPDSDPITINTPLRSTFGTKSAGAFDLLSANRRDCVGPTSPGRQKYLAPLAHRPPRERRKGRRSTPIAARCSSRHVTGVETNGASRLTVD